MQSVKSTILTAIISNPQGCIYLAVDSVAETPVVSAIRTPVYLAVGVPISGAISVAITTTIYVAMEAADATE